MQVMETPKEKAQTVQEVFQYLQDRFQMNRLNRTLVFHFLIEEESWTMQVSQENLKIESRSPLRDADCTLIISKEIFMNTFNRKYTPSMMDLVSGRIKCNRPELLLSLKQVFRDE
jgi:hypothetical protein